MHTRYRATQIEGYATRTATIAHTGTSPLLWYWHSNSILSMGSRFTTAESVLKDEKGSPSLPYRFKNCTHITRKHTFAFDHKLDIDFDDQHDDQTTGTFVTSSGSPELFSDASSVTAHSAFDSIARPVKWAQVSLSEIEGWYEDSRIPGGITVDKDAIRSDFSIWYLLVDVKDLFFGLRHWIPQLRKLRGKATTSRKGYTAKAIVDNHLQYQFGLIPTWHDIVACIEAFKRLQNAAEDLKRIASELHKYRVKPITLEKRNIVEADTTTTLCGMVVPVRQRIQVSSPRLWHGTLYYTFKCEALQGLVKRLKYFADLFGVLDGAAAWDVVPWSFVVDWFIDVGGWLHEHSPKLYPVDVNVKDYCESLKQTVDVSYSLGDVWVARKGYIPDGEPRGIYCPFPPAKRIGGLLFARTRYEYFTRRRFIPNVRMGAKGLRLRNFGFSFRRTAIATSLVAQRVPRAKSWSDDFDILKDIDFGDRVNIRPIGKAGVRPQGR